MDQPLGALINPLTTEPRALIARSSFSLVSTAPRSSPLANTPSSRGPSVPLTTTLSSVVEGSAALQDSGQCEKTSGQDSADERVSSDANPSSVDSMSASAINLNSHNSAASPILVADELLRIEKSCLAAPLPASSPVVGKDPAKRRKPKSSLNSSGSTFVSRAITHEHLSKRLAGRTSDSVLAFANVGRSCQWLDLSASNAGEFLMKILFNKTQCLCHDINQATASSSHVDIVMGFATGDIIWLEPFSQRYSRINKNGIINPSPVLDVKWVPGSENLFLSCHKNGSVVMYDKERDDAPLDVDEEIGQGRCNTTDDAADEDEDGTFDSGQDYSVRMHIIKSTESRNQKYNPVALWMVSTKAVNAMAFAPDQRHLALACENNSWRIVDYLKEEYA